MRKETSQKAFVYHSIPSSRKFDVANKQKIKKNYSKEELGTFVGYQNEFVWTSELNKNMKDMYWIKSLFLSFL